MPKHRILIVDDDRDFLLAMRVRLEASGYEVIEASSIHDALTVVENQPRADLILLDIGFGVGNGIMLLDLLRSKEMVKAFPHIPVIILTAQPAPFLRDEATRRGVAAFFQKPADNAELLAAIRQALGAERS